MKGLIFPWLRWRACCKVYIANVVLPFNHLSNTFLLQTLNNSRCFLLRGRRLTASLTVTIFLLLVEVKGEFNRATMEEGLYDFLSSCLYFVTCQIKSYQKVDNYSNYCSCSSTRQPCCWVFSRKHIPGTLSFPWVLAKEPYNQIKSSTIKRVNCTSKSDLLFQIIGCHPTQYHERLQFPLIFMRRRANSFVTVHNT